MEGEEGAVHVEKREEHGRVQLIHSCMYSSRPLAKN